MYKKTAISCAALLALLSTESFAEGLLGKQYLSLSYQHGELGDSHGRKTMDSTKGIAITYNRPTFNNIDLGLSAEINGTDGSEMVQGTSYDIDFKIGGVTSYATLINPITEQANVFISPQIGWQKSKTKSKAGKDVSKREENDLFLGLDCGVEYTINRFVITPVLSISRANETNINGKLGLGFNITNTLMLTAGGNYQFNENNDYMVTAGVAFRF